MRLFKKEMCVCVCVKMRCKSGSIVRSDLDVLNNSYLYGYLPYKCQSE